MVDSSWEIANGERNEHTLQLSIRAEKIKSRADESKGEGFVAGTQIRHNTTTQPHSTTIKYL